MPSPGTRFVVLSAALAAGCVPDFEDDTSRVAAPRVLAVQATPAEAAEGESVTLRALVASSDEGANPDPDWSLCIDRKPLSELGPVSPACLASAAPGAEIALPLGRGAEVPATMPDIACQLFGPERPEPKPGEPSGRPVDPDPSGGFHQPVLTWLGPTAALGGVRLSCPINATVDATIEFNQRYLPNENPMLASFEARYGGTTVTLDGDEPAEIEAGLSVELRVTWPDCPAETACPGAETYVLYDPGSQTIVERKETLVVSWYATDGLFDEARTDRVTTVGAGGEPGTTNRWIAPDRDGTVRLWAVVRDDRGGVSWLSGNVVLLR